MAWVSSAQSVRSTLLKSSGNDNAEQQLFSQNQRALGHLYTLLNTRSTASCNIGFCLDQVWSG